MNKTKTKIIPDDLINILKGKYEPDSVSYKQFIKELNKYSKDKTYDELKREFSALSAVIPRLYEGIYEIIDNIDLLFQLEERLQILFRKLDDKSAVLLINTLVLHKASDLPSFMTQKIINRIYFTVANEDVILYASKAFKRINNKEKQEASIA